MSRLRRIAFGSTGLAVVAVSVAFTSPQTSAGVSATLGDGSVRFQSLATLLSDRLRQRSALLEAVQHAERLRTCELSKSVEQLLTRARGAAPMSELA